MIIRYRVQANLPPPARTAVHVVQTALKVSRSVAQKLIHDGLVSCKGRTIAQTHFKLNVDDEVEIDYVRQPVKTPRKKSKATSAERFRVVHDDEHLVVVNKPAGILTVPTRKSEKNTLVSQLGRWVRQQDVSAQAICVHRLDRGVSGLLVFAKNEVVAERLVRQFAARKPRRQYAAVVQGHLPQAKGTFRNYLATHSESLSRYGVSSSEEGELAITNYTVRERWKDTTLVDVSLETGRRNQIRVHFAEFGHPVLGDTRYRPDDARHVHWPFPRIALHAESLAFSHPCSEETLRFTTSWPQEFRRFRRLAGQKRE